MNTNGIMCVKQPKRQKMPYERPCMVVLQRDLVQSSLRHGASSHCQSPREERQNRENVGQLVSFCLSCQQVRDTSGDVSFYLKYFKRGYYYDFVQFDQIKICPSVSDDTGILVTDDHFYKFAEGNPCSNEEHDAATTSRLLILK